MARFVWTKYDFWRRNRDLFVWNTSVIGFFGNILDRFAEPGSIRGYRPAAHFPFLPGHDRWICLVPSCSCFNIFSKIKYWSYSNRFLYSRGEIPVTRLKNLLNMACDGKFSLADICCMVRSVDRRRAWLSLTTYSFITFKADLPVWLSTTEERYFGVMESRSA